MQKTLKILGATGSIGKNTCNVIKRFKDKIKLIAFSFGNNVEGAEEILKEFKPWYIGSLKREDVEYLRTKYDFIKEAFWGDKGIEELAFIPTDIALSGISGAEAIVPTLRTFESSRRVALANKESVVMAGHIINRFKEERGVELIPVDSEHSAIFQSLVGERKEDIKRIILTASGGPFRNTPMERLRSVTVQDALHHPVWHMGKKVTIDSSTLANKGLEIIEAAYLFDVPHSMIDVVIHPQSIIHSMVEFRDNSIKAQLGVPDMRLPIQYALFYPERLDFVVDSLSLVGKKLEFFTPDEIRFPALSLAREALRIGGTMTTIYNRANEEAVNLFLKEKISFMDIPEIIEKEMKRHEKELIRDPSIEEILQIDERVKREIRELYGEG